MGFATKVQFYFYIPKKKATLRAWNVTNWLKGYAPEGSILMHKCFCKVAH